MSLGIDVAMSGMRAAQAAIDIAGNNIANATTPNYARRAVLLTAQSAGAQSNNVLAGGVAVADVARICDLFLQNRMNSQQAAMNKSETESGYLTEMEGALGEPGDLGVNAALSEFFGAWQALAANPEDSTARTTVLQAGEQVAALLRQICGNLESMALAVRAEIRDNISQVNDLTARLVENNDLMANAVASGASTLDLQDERDDLIEEIVGLVGGEAVPSDSGATTISVNGSLLVSGAMRMELTAGTGGQEPILIASGGANAALEAAYGKLGGLRELTRTLIPDYLEKINQFAISLLGCVNAVHASGMPATGRFTEITGAVAARDMDADGDCANDLLSSAGLAVSSTAGAFTINVCDQGTGVVTAHTINVDPDAQSLGDLAGAINAIPNLYASISGGKLRIAAAEGYEFDFCADQETNILASLGLNSFFVGDNAGEIAVSGKLMADPACLAAGRSLSAGDGSNATAMFALQDAGIGDSNISIVAQWQGIVTELGSESSRAQRQQEAQQGLVAMLADRQQSISGVSLDEEAADLLRYQEMYRSSAFFVQVASKLMDTLLTYLG